MLRSFVMLRSFILSAGGVYDKLRAMNFTRFTCLCFLNLALLINAPCQALSGIGKSESNTSKTESCTTAQCTQSPRADAEAIPFDVELVVKDVIGKKKANLAFAFAIDGAKPIGYRAEDKVILMSVFKFHLALAFLDYSREKKIAIDHSNMKIPASVWEFDTWSPLRKVYRGQTVSLSLSDLLCAAVRDSDNIATDLLIDYMGGIAALNERLKNMGVEGFNLEVNEAEMNRNHSNISRNFSSPAAVVASVQNFLRKEILHQSDRNYLYNILLTCSTGKDKMKALLPKEVLVGHKTGNSPRSKAGLRYADNDAGFILLPDGRILYLAIFVLDSMESNASNAAIIAELTKRVYDYALQIPAK